MEAKLLQKWKQSKAIEQEPEGMGRLSNDDSLPVMESLTSLEDPIDLDAISEEDCEETYRKIEVRKEEEEVEVEKEEEDSDSDSDDLDEGELRQRIRRIVDEACEGIFMKLRK